MPSRVPRGEINQLLRTLPGRDRTRLLADCEPTEMVLGEVVYEQGERLSHVYFPTTSYVSMLTRVDAASVLEVGLIGREGMLGATVLLGGKVAPLQSLVQGSGSAWRMKSVDFRGHLAALPALRTIVQSYLYVLLRQLAQTVACTRFHLVDHRLARWLLMTQDRAGGDHIAMTQEFLAHMLGVRRVGVTEAAGVLQAQELIRYHRGSIEILDRAGLEAAACACYHDDLATYRNGLATAPLPTIPAG